MSRSTVAGDATSDDRERMHFRRCVGSFPTGVTVVTASRGEHRVGMTLNSFTSVSLDPLLVLVSLAHDSRTLEVVRQTSRFAVSVLRQGQEDIARDFATRGGKFPDEHVLENGGFVVVRDALAVIRCTVVDRIPAGDHDVMLAEVQGFNQSDGSPLVFHRGEYAALGEPATAG